MNSLEGKLLILRALETDDLELLYEWENDPENWQVSKMLTPFSKTILRKYLDDSHLDIYQIKQLRLVITLKKSKRTVGFIDLFDFDPFHQRAGIGVLIGNKADREKGYAGEALELLLEYCFSILMLNQVYCNILETNISSQKLFSRAGFTKIGSKKDWIRTSKGWVD